MEESVITHISEANLGSIYGWGFPAHKGGVMQFIEDYGIDKFYNRCLDLSNKYGKRFTPPAILTSMKTENTKATI